MDSEPLRRAFQVALEAHLRAAERHEASADLLTQQGKRDWAEVARARAAAERRAYADALQRGLGGSSVPDGGANGSPTFVVRIAPVDGS
jgi:hypothetical protein